MGNYTFWAKFGAVRGLIGAGIGSIMAIVLYIMACPMIYQKLHQDMVLSTGGTVQALTQTAMIAALPIAFLAAIIISSFEYVLGNAVNDFFDVEAQGVWRAMANGVVGDLILMMVLLFITSLTLTYVPANAMHVNPVALILATIPAGLVCEVGYATVTWVVMDKLGWL